MNLLIMGAPGAGKGTMSEKIVAKYNVAHVSTGDILRAAIKENSALGLEAKKYMDEGKLVPDELINDIVKERLNAEDMKNGWLMDGYPRTAEQAATFEKMLNEIGQHVDAVIKLAVDEESLIKRITGRRICPNCKAVYHIETKKPQVDGVCDECHTELVQRKDDNEEALKVRLDAYNSQFGGIEKIYAAKDLVKEVNANQDPSNVFADIEKVLG